MKFMMQKVHDETHLGRYLFKNEKWSILNET